MILIPSRHLCLSARCAPRQRPGYFQSRLTALEHVEQNFVGKFGRPITLKGITIYRVEGGKLMERWVVSDLYGVLEESGALSRIA